MHRGYIKLWRKIEEWTWYKDYKVFGLWLHLLIGANYKDSSYMGVNVPRGSLVTGLYALSEQTGLSVQNIRTIFRKLKSTNDITIKSTNHFSVVSIVKFEQYQENPTNKTTSKPTIHQQTTNKPLTTSKEGKNLRTQEDKESAPRDDSKQICLKDINCKNQSEAVKHKIFNQIVSAFKVRGWRTDPEYVKRVFGNIVLAMNGHEPKDFFPYFRKVAQNYINENADALAADARMNRGQEKKMGITVMGMSL